MRIGRWCVPQCVHGVKAGRHLRLLRFYTALGQLRVRICHDLRPHSLRCCCVLGLYEPIFLPTPFNALGQSPPPPLRPDTCCTLGSDPRVFAILYLGWRTESLNLRNKRAQTHRPQSPHSGVKVGGNHKPPALMQDSREDARLDDSKVLGFARVFWKL